VGDSVGVDGADVGNIDGTFVGRLVGDSVGVDGAGVGNIDGIYVGSLEGETLLSPPGMAVEK
jgi:hypothetical protein